MTNQTCPSCLKSETAEAMMEKYCMVCGMGIGDSNKKFCCNKCLSKFRGVLKDKKIRGGLDGRNNKVRWASL